MIGYINAPHRRSGESFTTGEMGVRLSRTLQAGEPSPSLPTGGVLAVGDSFVFGSEANDNESWPAYLEHELGIPVVNGGTGGYGYDQAVMRGAASRSRKASPRNRRLHPELQPTQRLFGQYGTR
jgi:hypothetical protein